LPVILNGFLVAVVALVAGALLLGVPLPAGSWAPLAMAIAVCSTSCTGLGLLGAAIALRVRETAVMSNVIFGVLMIFAGVNVPLASLPAWMSSVAHWLPLTHGIGAARKLVAGSQLADVGADLVAEMGLGVLYAGLGLALLAWLERDSRRKATLDTY
jgi:ABC-2 type transport system permease protein